MKRNEVGESTDKIRDNEMKCINGSHEEDEGLDEKEKKMD